MNATKLQFSKSNTYQIRIRQTKDLPSIGGHLWILYRL